ncbi:MAG: hypothetical protein JSV01_07490 [Desulfobacterales bacterium]|nr:MAG: hypothetical protein JSV01_07490 [Desulfobacterales bacterium]
MKKLLMLIAFLVILPTAAYSKEKKQASAETIPKMVMETSPKLGDDWLNVEITTSQQETIKRYFRGDPQADLKGHKVAKPKKLPPGLQKKLARGCDLPPGWQKKIARGEVLDLEVYQQAKRLPVELTKRLPPAPEGTVLVKVEGKVIRLYEATRTILDVFDIGT